MAYETGGNHPLKTLLDSLRDIFFDAAYLLPVAAFIFISSTPAQALAYSQYIEISHQPLRFVRDPSLAGTAIVGLEAWPKYRTAGQALSSSKSRVPDASPDIKPGMAIRVLATAYSSTVDQTDANPWRTASGTTVHPGTLATNFLPFGAKVRIGNTTYTVEDRMNPRYNGKYIIDIWQESRTQALQFGVRVVEMEVVSIP